MSQSRPSAKSQSRPCAQISIVRPNPQHPRPPPPIRPQNPDFRSPGVPSTMGRQEALRPLELPLGRLPRLLTGAVVVNVMACRARATRPPAPRARCTALNSALRASPQERNTPLGGCRVRSRDRVRSHGGWWHPHACARAPSARPLPLCTSSSRAATSSSAVTLRSLSI
jgi:hypothetical protein